MKELRADLHIHTCLSPCADRRMLPAAIVGRARDRGLDMIAICDHNSAENVEAVRRAGAFPKGPRRSRLDETPGGAACPHGRADVDLAVIGGMEITSREEVHVLGIFQDAAGLRSAQEAVYRNLRGRNDPRTFGEQWVVDEDGKVLAQNERLLIGATDLALEEVVGTIHRFGGLAIAAHVDRPSFSILSQLGFIPPNLGLDGVEVFREEPPGLPKEVAVVRSSDAHQPEQIGRQCTRFLVEEPTAREIGMAMRGSEGRRIVA